MTQDRVSTPLLESRRPWSLVTNAAELSSALESLAQTEGSIAIDAERASGFKYSSRAYLIQVARRTGPIFLIDPIATDLAQQNKFADLVNNQTWILHAATQDLPCLAELGLRPSGIIDTELGSRIAGLPRVGLGAGVEHYLGLGLAKEHSAVDWSTRPLEHAWLEYAALDVDVLHELSDALLEDLRKQGKLDFAEQEFDNLLGFRPKSEKPDRWRSVSGLHEVKDQRGLAIARALWTAREELAIKLDVSPGRLIPDLSISHVAKTQTKTRPELATDRKFSGRASRSYLDTWWQAIESGRNDNNPPPLRLPSVGIPNHRIWPRQFPEAHKRLLLAKEFITKIESELAIPAENLLTPDFLRQVCFTDREVALAEDLASELKVLGARQWQINLLAAGIAQAICKAKNYQMPDKVTSPED